MNTKPCEVLPGILEKDWAEIEKKIITALEFSSNIHIDLLDGKFAQNTTFLDPNPFAKYTKDAVFELHMMVENPLQYLAPWANAGFKRFIGHIEKMPDQVEFVANAQALGEVGLALDAESKPEDIKVSFEDLDCLLVMTIRAGFSGQAFMPELLDKVQYLSEHAPFLSIEVDGGINDQTITQAYQKGAFRFVSTSFLFSSDVSAQQYKKLVSLV